MRLIDCYADTPGRALRTLNQIKHTAESFAIAMGLATVDVQALLDGADVDHRRVLEAMGRHPAVDLATIIPAVAVEELGIPVRDAKPFVVMRAAETARSARVFQRGRPPARHVPFYRYFDTAVQPSSPFRPELIEQLLVHDGIGDLDRSYFNNGHFESQLTVYLDDSNLHWLGADSRSHTFRASRYAATYKLPFVKHTFTARSHSSAILAVTYLGPLATADGLDRAEGHEHPRSSPTPAPIIESLNDGGSISDASGIYPLLPLISTQPSTRAYLMRLAPGQELQLERLDVDRWLYHAAGATAAYGIGETRLSLDVGDSVCVAPGRSLTCSSAGSADLICFEVKRGEGDAAAELAGVIGVAGEEGLERLALEDRRWFT